MVSDPVRLDRKETHKPSMFQNRGPQLGFRGNGHQLDKPPILRNSQFDDFERHRQLARGFGAQEDRQSQPCLTITLFTSGYLQGRVCLHFVSKTTSPKPVGNPS